MDLSVCECASQWLVSSECPGEFGRLWKRMPRRIWIKRCFWVYDSSWPIKWNFNEIWLSIIIIISYYFTYISQFAMLTPYTAMGQQPPCHEDHVMQELEAECARLRQMVETGAGRLSQVLFLVQDWWRLGGSTIENFKITCRCFLFVKKLRPVSLATRNV